MGCCGGKVRGYTPGDVRNWAGANSRWAKAGKPVRSQEAVEWIEANCCRSCEYYSNGRCAICRCKVTRSENPRFNKIKMATENCPVGRWPSDETIDLYLSGALKMPDAKQPVSLPIEPGLYWAKVRPPRMMRGPGGQPMQSPPLPEEPPLEEWNAIVTVWRGPRSSQATAYLFSETMPRALAVPPGTLIEIGEKIVQPENR